MKKVIVKLENFKKQYGEKVVIKDINLEVYEGEFLTLLGSSGCGKTTILRSISGLDNPSSGKVYIDGVDVTNLDPTKRHVNTIFQNYALFPLMTIEDNIGFGLKMKKVKKDEIKKRVNEMLELVHLTGYEKRKPKELSGGEQQRVSIARGLINNPKVLLLDEPLSALDQKLRRDMQIELKQLQKKLGITFIYVTHSQDEALTMSDRIVLLKDGKIEQVDTPVNIYEKPNSLYVADFLGESNLFKGKVVSKKEEFALVELDDGNTIKVIAPNAQVGDNVDIIIRPENIKLGVKEIKGNCLSGVIKEQIYDGAYTNILVKVGKKIIKTMFMGNDKIYSKKQEVFLTWDIEDAIVLLGENDEERK